MRIVARLAVLAMGLGLGLGIFSAPAAHAAAQYRLVSLDGDAAGRCLTADGVYGASLTVSMHRCALATYGHQSWVISYYDDRSAQIALRSNHYARCLDGWAGRGKQVTHQRCDDSDRAQRWWKSGPNDAMVFKNAKNGYCLDVADWGRSSVVMLYDCHETGNQRWKWAVW